MTATLASHDAGIGGMASKTATLIASGDGLRFSGRVGSGHTLDLDDGIGDAGMRPAELLPLAVAGCTALDVLSILRKKQQRVARYEVSAVGEQAAGTPARFRRIEVQHLVEGAVDETALRRSIELSATRYCAVGATLSSGDVSIHHGYRLRTPDGTERSGEVVVTGPYAGRDEQAAAQEAADRGLAHDLRNLLTAIDGHAQLARDALALDDPARDDLDEVLAAASRAHQLTVDRLAGPTSATPAVPQPLDALVREALPLLAAVTGPEVGVEVRLGAPGSVRIPRLSLERVLLNLCLNARDSMPDGGRITIGTRRRPEGSLEVSVRDTGPGIDPAIVERLADPVALAGSSTDGHGLGLATSAALLAAAGGRLEVEVDGGTVMRAVLPAT